MGAVISLLSSPVIGAIVASIVVVVATTAFLYFKYRGDDSSVRIKFKTVFILWVYLSYTVSTALN
jgi:hypothetical protein